MRQLAMISRGERFLLKLMLAFSAESSSPDSRVVSWGSKRYKCCLRRLAKRRTLNAPCTLCWTYRAMDHHYIFSTKPTSPHVVKVQLVLIFYFLVVVVLGFELLASHLLSKHTTNLSYNPTHWLVLFNALTGIWQEGRRKGSSGHPQSWYKSFWLFIKLEFFSYFSRGIKLCLEP
jgi:hypothetical protein